MKTIGRILLILLAITAVASITYALGQTQVFAQPVFGDGLEGRRPPEGEFPAFWQLPGNKHKLGSGLGLSIVKQLATMADAWLAETLRPEVDFVLMKPISFAQLRDLAGRLRPSATV